MTSPAFQALSFAYQRTAKVQPDRYACAVLALLSAYVNRESKGGEAQELLFLATVCRNAAQNLGRFEVRASIAAEKQA